MDARELLVHKVKLTSTIFDCDDAQVVQLSGRETISSLYQYKLTLVYPEGGGANVEPVDIVGADAKLTFFSADSDELRTVHGIIARACLVGSDETVKYRTFELLLVPRAWRLTLVKTQEIFMDSSVPDIIQEKLKRLYLHNYGSFSLLASYPEREFVVQYKETDRAFISRLAEHLGMSFYFVQGDEQEKMVFTDHNDGFAEPLEVLFHAGGYGYGIYALSSTAEMAPHAFGISDYNYRIPDVDITGLYELPTGVIGGVVEYGSHHKTSDEADALAKIRAEEFEAKRYVHQGSSVVPSLFAGFVVKVANHPWLADQELLVTDIEHHYQANENEDARAGSRHYHNTFRAVPRTKDSTFRPPRVTQRPRIDGVVTGIIQPGPGGEVGGFAQLDSEGRYTVQFHFDTKDESGRKASRPVRMAQPFAGPNQGMHFPLRPGTEVLLVFIDGDPDRPIIAGAVTNPITPSPITNISANKSRIKMASGVVVELSEGR